MVISVYTEKQTRAPRGRPRNEGVHQAILKAAASMLQDIGYFEMSMEAVAGLAKVGKPTIYRWWPSKAYLVLEVLIENGKDHPPLPDTGSLESDLLVFFKNWSRGMKGKTSTAFNGLIAEAQVDKKLGQQLQRFIAIGKEAFLLILQRGSERNEIASDVDTNVLADLIYGSKWYRFLLNPKPIDDDFAKQVIEIIRHLRP